MREPRHPHTITARTVDPRVTDPKKHCKSTRQNREARTPFHQPESSAPRKALTTTERRADYNPRRIHLLRLPQSPQGVPGQKPPAKGIEASPPMCLQRDNAI